MAPMRRKQPIVQRRRVDDEGEEDGGPDTAELEDDLMTDGSLTDEDLVEDSEIGDTPAASPQLLRAVQNGHAKSATTEDTKPATADMSTTTTSVSAPNVANGISDTEMMLHGLQLGDREGIIEETSYEDLKADLETTVETAAQPRVVTSSAQMDQPQETPFDRRRREHEEYKQKRDADPAFVPNRGSFFMHDHRHAGPAANGFRPFGRGRGRGRGGIGGPYAPSNHVPHVPEPTDTPWTHDMHEAVATTKPEDKQGPSDGALNLSDSAVSLSQKPTPINRALSTTKHIGNVQIRVFLEHMEKPVVFPGVPVKQYTRLPDHRPPLRRDKPVRISLPDHPARYIFPATDRSFIFIPRAMRPNQQGFGARSRARPAFGSIGGFSRRTSIYGGGSAYGSTYSPSVAMSRRSSLAHELTRENILSPTGSTMSRPPLPMDTARPVVRLPPSVQPPVQQMPPQPPISEPQPITNGVPTQEHAAPLTYPLPQKPTFRENRPSTIPMHQPRPQKAVSVADIESPATYSFNAPQQQQQQPFHQQVPLQVNGNGYHHDHLKPHARNPSYPNQASTGTPLSQIPERAIHAQPFQPYQPQPQQAYYPQPYQVMPPQPGFYYPAPYGAPMGPAGAPAFVPQQPPQQPQYAPPPQQDPSNGQSGATNLVAQEANGMVYYYDAAQIQAIAPFPTYPPQPMPMPAVGGVVGMGGMMTPSPDGFYYPQAAQGMVYYSQ